MTDKPTTPVIASAHVEATESRPPELIHETYVCSCADGMVEWGYCFKKPGSDDIVFDLVIDKAHSDTGTPDRIDADFERFEWAAAAISNVSAYQDVKTHTLSYCYPTSSNAIEHGFGKTGCYLLNIKGKDAPYATFKDAYMEVVIAKSAPTRWSMDHCLNLAFLSGELQEVMFQILQSTSTQEPK